MQPIPVSEYHQMAGRAGRPRLDPYGEAVLIAKDEAGVAELFDCYIEAPAEDVHSKIADPAALYTHVLSLIASGFADTRSELARFMERTFYVHEHRQGRVMQKSVESALKFLIAEEMVMDVGEHLCSTEFGTLVSRLYIDPRSAAMIVKGLRTKKEYADLGLLQLICSTPDMPRLYARNSDISALTRMEEAHEDELWMELPVDGEEAELYYRALKTTLLLSDWTDELPDTKICERYAVGPGDIFGMVESINWLLHATAELSRMFAPAFQPKIREFEICMKNGIRRELLPLVKLRGIGRVRARRLFNNNLKTPEEVLKAGIGEVTKIIGLGIADQIFAQLQGNRRTSPAKEEDGVSGQATLFQFR